MALQTLPQPTTRRRDGIVRRPVTTWRWPASNRTSKLEGAEDALIAKAMQAHPKCEAALDAALDDMAALSAEVRNSRRRPLLLRSATQLNKIEDLLLEAVVRTHPNREHALDRLMDDLAGLDPPAQIYHDNDFDRLG